MSGENPWQNNVFAERNIAHLDKRFLPGTIQEVDFLERRLRLEPGMRVADLGCGCGRHSIELARRGYKVTALDISPVLVEETRRRAESAGVEIVFHVADMGRICGVVPLRIGVGCSGRRREGSRVARSCAARSAARGKPGPYDLQRDPQVQAIWARDAVRFREGDNALGGVCGVCGSGVAAGSASVHAIGGEHAAASERVRDCGDLRVQGGRLSRAAAGGRRR